jgi:serine/threonine-protein kinase RsbW
MTLDSTPESVDAAGVSVRRFTEEAGFDDSDTYFIALAVHEILVNAVIHGNRFDPKKKVELRLSADETRLTVEVKDEGAGFCLESVPDPRLEENLALPSGRGITIARGIMDDFHVESGSAGTYVRMSKARARPIIGHVHANP